VLKVNMGHPQASVNREQDATVWRPTSSSPSSWWWTGGRHQLLSLTNSAEGHVDGEFFLRM